MPTGQQATYAGAGGLMAIGKIREKYGKSSPDAKQLVDDTIKAGKQLPRYLMKKFINITNQT